MLIAAHPDDESLACSVLLQRAVGAAAAIRVVYLTDGENNPWPQRVFERKWRLDEGDRKRWGTLRRAEAIAALELLGVSEANTTFLGLPDQRLTEELTSNSERIVTKVAEIVDEWSPTHIFTPSVFDIHPDHSALGVLLRLVADNLSESTMSFWSYLVHGNCAAFRDCARSIGQTAEECEIKLRAIGCHRTQVRLFGKRFWNHARQPERFVNLDSDEATSGGGIVASVLRDSQVLSLKLERPLRAVPPRKPTLLILGYGEDSSVSCLKINIPGRTSAFDVRDVRTGRAMAMGRYWGGAFTGNLEVPLTSFASDRPLFIKAERRGWFFDEAGWLEVAPCVLQEIWQEPATREELSLLCNRAE